MLKDCTTCKNIYKCSKICNNWENKNQGNLHKVVKVINERKKKIMDTLNNHGNYTFLEDMTAAEIDLILKDIEITFDHLDKVITKEKMTEGTRLWKREYRKENK